MTNKSIAYKPISKEIQELVVEHGHEIEETLEVLKGLEAGPIGLTKASVTDAARALGIPPHKAYGMATFYSMLSFEERQHVLRVCDGPVCWLKRAKADRHGSMVKGWEKSAGEGYTVERSSCLGLCDRAPAVLVDDEQAGPLCRPVRAQYLG